MPTSKSLPARPSLESLRKQARKLKRDVAAGSGDAIARVQVHLPDAGAASLSRRDAQWVVAREYGFRGWTDLVAEVHVRTGQGLEWAASRAGVLIHDNEVDKLKQLLSAYPALLSWRGEGDGVLGYAVNAYGDSFDPEREGNFTRRECAELLLDAGAVVLPSLLDGLITSRTRGMLRLFQSRGLLPQTPRFLAALGDLDGVRAWFDQHAGDIDPSVVNDAFMCACRFEHEDMASLLLDHCIALDPELGRQVDDTPGRTAFIRYLSEERPLEFTRSEPSGPWEAFIMRRVMRAIHDDDLASFTGLLQRESWLLSERCVGFQVGLIQRATMRDRGAFIERLLALDPALLRVRPPQSSQAIEFALTYARPHLIPALTRVWPLPDDLPHAAGIGDLDRVKRWFAEAGRPELDTGDRQSTQEATQAVLDHALAWAVLNGHYEIADFLLSHGADINTRWSSHEPASILHELVFRDDYEAMQFLIDRGIDMTILDYRWNATAEGWARYGANNRKLADWLAEAERRREEAR